jgi:hypothetical protein
MRKFLPILTLVASILFAQVIIAQTGVKGVIKDSQTKETLIGATVMLQGTSTGVATDASGKFMLEAPAGDYQMDISYVGYDAKVVNVTIKSGEVTNLGTITLDGSAIGIAGVSIIADRAKERETPVAFSNVEKVDIENKLGSRDLPMVMNFTPSVYATPQGGGAGDARINVRGFNQRNVAIMINGVPVNDMENGWVYWSNWDGIADATSSIQMQRGLSAVNLATPSIGGTMNVLTSPAEMKAGGSARVEFGSGNFFKTTLTGHTGMINEKFSMSVSAVRKVGEGVIDKTWTDAWAYYLGASYNINKNHRLEVYAVGAPQRHGQNLYKQNVAAYDQDYAKEIGADTSTLSKFFQSPNGRLYNENWNTVDEGYNGQQYFNGKTVDRYKKDFLAERENYYHKPITNLNWYAQWSDKVTQFTTVYYSGGKGGGTGTYGSLVYDYDSEPTRIVDWDGTIARNQDPESGKQGILRNSVNNQWTIGAISKVKVNFSENLKTQFGVDWRTAEIEHYREVRDLLGLTSYDDAFTQNDFGSQLGLGLGDKIAYNNTNTVDWLGFFAQAEYSTGLLSVYGTVGYSMIKYGYTNHFLAADTLDNGDPDVGSGELKSETDWIAGYQLKGGANYNISETFNVFANVGYVSKVPIFDNVIDDGDGTVAADPDNEKFTSFEVGAIYSSIDDKLVVKGNYYYTTWTDRTFTRSVQLDEFGTTGIAFISGMKQNHNGFELEASYRPIKFLGVGAVASLANWKYLSDVNAIVKNYDGGNISNDTVNVYADGLKVGDAPQTQFGLSATLFPIDGMSLEILWRYNAKHFADFDPTNRDDPDDMAQVWETPDYSVFDLHFNYRLPLKSRVGIDVFAHVFNLFDTFYVQDALDNSPYNGNYDNGGGTTFNHDVNTAEVYLGLPRTFNVGLRVNFQ